MLHPIVPFVTEQVWQALGQVAPVRGLPNPLAAEESVCIAAWPKDRPEWHDERAEGVVAQWREKVAAIRNLRAERNVPNSVKIAPIIEATGETAAILEQGRLLIESLTNSSKLTITAQAELPAECAVAILGDAKVILPLDGLIDREAETARHRKSLADVEKQLSAIQGKLRNEGFVSRAPAEVVQQQKAKEAELVAQRESLLRLIG